MKVLRKAHDVLSEILATQALQQANVRVRHKDLRDLILASKIHDRLGDITAAKDARFNLEASCEAKMLFYCLSFLGR